MTFKRKPAAYYFQEKQQAKHIGKKSVRAYLYTASTNGIKFFINIATVSILARILVPEDFGYVAMAAAFVSTPKIVIGQHLPLGVVQSSVLRVRQLNAFFWLSFGITILAAGGTWAASPLVAWFFEDPRLTGITRAMTLMVLFAGLTSVHGSLLSRTMQFGIISGVDLISRIVSKVVAIVLAVSGFGYWALVFMPVSFEGARMILLWWFCRFRPGIDGAGSNEGRDLLKIGSVWSGNSMLSSLVAELDKVIIGKFLSSQALGLYSRSFNLAELPGKFIAWPLTSIAVSALSRLQDDHEKFKRYFFILTEGFFIVFVPIMMLLYLSADHIVLLILGEKWRMSIPVFMGLIPLFLLKNLIRPVGWYLMSTYRADHQIKKIVTMALIMNGAFVLGVLGGIYWGLMGIVFSVVFCSLCSYFIAVFYVFRDELIRAVEFLALVWRPSVAGFAALFISLYLPLDDWQGAQNHFLQILVNTIAGALVYVGCFLLLPNGKRVVFDVMVNVKAIVKSKTGASGKSNPENRG